MLSASDKAVPSVTERNSPAAVNGWNTSGRGLANKLHRPTQTRNRVHIVSILIFGNNCLHRRIHCKRTAMPETPSTVKNRRQYFRCMPHQPSPQRSSPMVRKTSTIPPTGRNCCCNIRNPCNNVSTAGIGRSHRKIPEKTLPVFNGNR